MYRMYGMPRAQGCAGAAPLSLARRINHGCAVRSLSVSHGESTRDAQERRSQSRTANQPYEASLTNYLFPRLLGRSACNVGQFLNQEFQRLVQVLPVGGTQGAFMFQLAQPFVDVDIAEGVAAFQHGLIGSGTNFP